MDFMHAIKTEKKSDPKRRDSRQRPKTDGQRLPQRIDGSIYDGRELGTAVPVQRKPNGLKSWEQQREEQQRVEQQRTKNRVMTEFISPKHIDALEEGIRSTNTIIGFRAAGAATLARMGAGAAPKPHTILDKSLKAGEFGAVDEGSNDAASKMIEALEGLVPYREGGQIKGLHLSTKGANFFGTPEMKNFNQNVIEIQKNGRKYLACDPTSTGDPFVQWLLSNLESDPQFEYAKYFVTGDYDLHDMILKTAQGAPVPSDSPDEGRILTRLSDSVMGRPRRAVQFHFAPDEFSPIQHGPQYNYIAHMMDKEKGAPIVKKVADLDLKVALFDGREWTILDHSMPGDLQGLDESQVEKIRREKRAEQSRALKDYYDAHGLKLKWTWSDLPEAQKYLSQFL